MPRRRLGWRRSWPRWRRSPQPGAGAEQPRWLGDARTPTQPGRGRRSPAAGRNPGRDRAGIPHRAPTRGPAASPTPAPRRGRGRTPPFPLPAASPPHLVRVRAASSAGRAAPAGAAVQRRAESPAAGRSSLGHHLPPPPPPPAAASTAWAGPSRRTALTRQRARPLPPAASRRERGPTGVGGAAPVPRRGRG